MKRLISIMLAACFAIAMHAQTHNITVRGTIEGLSSGRLYVTAQVAENKVDTFGQADFSSPEFVLHASIPEPLAAQITVQDYTGGFAFIAEPDSEYMALLKNGDGAYIKGGRLNDEWQAFLKYQASQRMKADTLRAHYETMIAQGKFRSASRVNDSLQAQQALIAHKTDSFLSSHDDIIASFTAQSNAVMKQINAAESMKLYERLGKNARKTVSARLMKERIDRLKQSETGNKAPDFTLPLLAEGQTLTLSEVRAKVKIIDFWASWCGPCRLNNPALRSVYADFHDKGLEIIGVSLDNKRDAWTAAVRKDQLTWPQASSLKGWKCDVARLYNVTSVPAIFILDERDNIIATNLRGEKLRAFLAERLK